MEDLRQYIESARASGMTDEQIKAELRRVGWTETHVSQAFFADPTAPKPLLDLGDVTRTDNSSPPKVDPVPQRESINSPTTAPVAAEPTPPLKEETTPTGFNWGAFWLTWIWGIGHRIWLSLLLIPLAIATAIFSLFYSFSSALESWTATSGQSSADAWLISGATVVVNLLISLCFGRKGTAWAWHRRGDRALDQFQRREKRWAVIGWVFGALVVLGWALFAVSLIADRGASNQFECTPGVQIEIGGINRCADESGEQTDTVSTTSFSGTGVRFDHNAAWQVKQLSALLETGGGAGDLTLFFTAAAMSETEQRIAAVKNDPNADFGAVFGLLFTVPQAAEMSVVTLEATTAQAAAEAASQSTCQGTVFESDTTAPIDSSRIEAITFANRPAYAVASQPSCQFVFYQVFVQQTNQSTVALTFNRAANLQALSADQKVVERSVQID